MAELDKVLLNLVLPIVNDQSCLRIEQELSENEKEVVLHVYAKNDDIARLIGRKGMMASALRQVMSVASHTDNRRVSIRFNEID
ncbi:MAG: KH domain-containing protein [Bulleidia sp.]